MVQPTLSVESNGRLHSQITEDRFGSSIGCVKFRGLMVDMEEAGEIEGSELNIVFMASLSRATFFSAVSGFNEIWRTRETKGRLCSLYRLNAIKTLFGYFRLLLGHKCL
ncbi:hypothetical protein U1Q18_020968 [Sarracenia purpurea var. burkii]